MKAVVVRSYGSPGQLRITDVDTPVPAADEVLVRVRATSVNPYDWHHVRGEPYVARLMPGSLGLRGPKIGILGCDMAGQVVGEPAVSHQPDQSVVIPQHRRTCGGALLEDAGRPWVPEEDLASGQDPAPDGRLPVRPA